MHPALVLFAVAAALAGAAAVPLTWWLGVRGIIAALNARGIAERAELLARLDAVEVLVERLVNRRQAEAGTAGREKQRQAKAQEEQTVEQLRQAAAAAIAADLGPPLKQKRLAAAPPVPVEEKDVIG